MVDFAPLELYDLCYEEHPMRILAREVKILRNHEIPYAKILWRNHEDHEDTRELESLFRQ